MKSKYYWRKTIGTGMKQNASDIFSGFLRMVDLVTIFAAFCLAYWLRFEPVGITFNNISIQFIVFLVSYNAVWFIISIRSNLYSTQKVLRFSEEIILLTKTATICIVISAIFPFFFRENPLSRLFLIYFYLLINFFQFTTRMYIRIFVRYFRLYGYHDRQIIIVGINDRARRIVSTLQENYHSGIRVFGIVDKDPDRILQKTGMEGRVVGDLNDIERLLKENVIDEIVVTLPIKSFYSEIERILSISKKSGVEVKMPIDFFNTLNTKSEISNYLNYEVIDFFTAPKMNWQLIMKRIIDISLSGFILILLSPMFAIVSLWIKINTNGPVLFYQKRIGYNGRVFHCIKFRTMIRNAEQIKDKLLEYNEMDGPVFKMKDDPRVTKVGRFLRKTSIDELPQLINVIKGDMSLVGPRPPVPEEVCQYDIEHRRRLSMKPGLTCLWQISGRNKINFDTWMELDREYIDTWSIWLDFKILFKTIPAVIKGEGAA